MAIGRGLIPSDDSNDRYAATFAAMLAELWLSSCQTTTSGSALFALALLRKELIRSRFHDEKPGPAMGVTVSSVRMRWEVRTQPAFQLPAAAVFQVQSGSFQTSQAATSLTEVATS